MIYDIRDFGAISGGGLCTEGIQKAIDACFLAGGGEVQIPRGDFLTGSVRLRSGVTLHLLEGAHLWGSRNPEDYMGFLEDSLEPLLPQDFTSVHTAVPGHTGRSITPTNRWNNAILRAIRAKGIRIIGERNSFISGQNCFDAQGEEGFRGPHAINLWFCEDVVLSGYTIRDCGNWAHAIQNSQRITAKGLTVLGGHDGFDIRTCDDIQIEGCRFCTGDDCIAGFDNINVSIRDCYFNCACSFLRFGGTHVLVENCQGESPALYGHRHRLSLEEKMAGVPTNEKCRHDAHAVFMYYCDNRAQIREVPGDILIRHCEFSGMDSILSLDYGHAWCCNRILGDITFEDCQFSGVSQPIWWHCPGEVAPHLTMTRCAVSPREGSEEISFLLADHIDALSLSEISLSGYVNPRIISPAVAKEGVSAPPALRLAGEEWAGCPYRFAGP